MQFSYRKLGVNPDFMGGGTVHDVATKANIRFTKYFRVEAGVQWEKWNFRALSSAPNSNVTTSIQLLYTPLVHTK